MGQGEMGIGESPASGPRQIGPGGIPMRKKVWPKSSPMKLTLKKNWKKSFGKFATKLGGKAT